MAKRKKPPRHYLRVRHYPDLPHCSVWLIRTDGTAESGLLWGELLPPLVDEVARVTGLEVVHEQQPTPAGSPAQPPGCAGVGEQKLLFQEQP